MYLSPLPPAPVHTVLAEASWLPVSLDAVKVHLGLAPEDDARDTELTAFILAALRAVEAYADIMVRRATVRADTEAFAERMRLKKRPFHAVTSVEYVQDVTGEILTVAATTYHAQRLGQHAGAVVLGRDTDWPADVADRIDAVQITYTVGWQDAASVPADVAQAILMTVAKLDANRGDCGCGDSGGGSVYAMKNSRPSVLPEAAALLLAPYLFLSLTVA